MRSWKGVDAARGRGRRPGVARARSGCTCLLRSETHREQFPYPPSPDPAVRGRPGRGVVAVPALTADPASAATTVTNQSFTVPGTYNLVIPPGTTQVSVTGLGGAGIPR